MVGSYRSPEDPLPLEDEPLLPELPPEEFFESELLWLLGSEAPLELEPERLLESLLEPEPPLEELLPGSVEPPIAPPGCTP